MLSFQLYNLFRNRSVEIILRIIHKCVDFLCGKSNAYKELDAPYSFDILIAIITIFISGITALAGGQQLFFLVIAQHVTSYAEVINYPFYCISHPITAFHQYNAPWGHTNVNTYFKFFNDLF